MVDEYMTQEKIKSNGEKETDSLIQFNGQLRPISEVRNYILDYTKNGNPLEAVSTICITQAKVEEWRKKQLRGEKLPDDWKEVVAAFRGRKRRVWDIELLKFNEKRAEYFRTCEMVEKMLEGKP